MFTLGLTLYILAQLAVGWWVSRKIRSQDDYLLAGRSFGYGLATFSLFATWFGAESLIGASGRVYEQGLSGAASDPFGYGLCLLLMGLVFAGALWSRKLSTLGDLFRSRFSPGVERIAVLLMIPASVLWASAQVRAFGHVLAGSTGLGLEGGMAVAAGVVIVYTSMGGLLADAWTDVLQGLVLILGLAILLVLIVSDLGGVSGTLAKIDPARLTLRHGSWADTAEAWAIPVCGSVITQELVSRILACRSPRIARGSSLAAGGIYLAVGLIPLLLGLVGPSVLPGLEHPEELMTKMSEQHFPALGHVLFTGAMVSAILSTVDSTLLAASALTTENLVVSLRPGLSDAAKLRISRIGVVSFGLLAWGLAHLSDSVHELVEDASAFGGGGIFVIVVLGLFTRIGGPWSALAALAAALATHQLAGAHPYLLSLAAALAAYLGVAALEARRVQSSP